MCWKICQGMKIMPEIRLMTINLNFWGDNLDRHWVKDTKNVSALEKQINVKKYVGLEVEMT